VIDRRDFIRCSALAGTALASVGVPGTALAAQRVRAVRSAAWLDGAAPALNEGHTWGVPWPRGSVRRGTRFAASDEAGAALPLQSWVTAWWPDGSVKWTAHAVPAGSNFQGHVRVQAGRPATSTKPVRVREGPDSIDISSGPLHWTIGRNGESIIRSASNNGRETIRDVKLVATVQDRPDSEEAGSVTRQNFVSEISAATVEQSGPVRAVVKIEGRHKGNGRAWLPFTMRLYFYAGSDAVRIVHSFIFDGDETKDFIRGLGLTGSVPMSDPTHDRHLRFAGEGDGVWGEAVRPITGLRRDPGKAARTAQVAGLRTPPVDQWQRPVPDLLRYVPEWGDFTLSQPNSDGFSITKRTAPGHGWVDVDTAGRANGLGYVGGVSGGAAFGMQDFWKKCPVRLDIRDAQNEAARFTIWYHSPDAPAMDMRFYHGGLGMDDYPRQNAGLDITYEDFEPGWGSAHGIARTTEFMLWALPATPSRERFAQMSAMVAKPPRLVARSEEIHASGVFGDWSLVDSSTLARRAIEAQNDRLLAYYMGQVEQRRWYGFWNYGDVMHTYDRDRHVWRYDTGGFAWDNSELSPDLWLWYSFLRSGRADVFRMAEAMTRHTGEVDVYHLGRFRGFGTRHGVQHWGDSSKQPRISNAAYRRIYYYLTADDRVGDLMRALVDSDRTLLNVEIGRKVGARARGSEPPGGTSAVVADTPPPAGQVFIQFGTTWSSLAAAWLTEWERTGNPRWRDRLVAGMTSIAALPKQWFAGGANFDLASGRFTGPGDEVSLSHLNAVFGAVETHSELLSLINVPAYREAWLDYCAYYNAPADEFQAKTGAPARGRNLKEGHSRLTAYAAFHRKDPRLAARAWREFFGGEAGLGVDRARAQQRIEGPAVLKPVDDDPWVSTNAAAQWGLAAIQNLALVGDALPAQLPVRS
jgi:hypothetical protein